ncbi:MAG: phosphatase [Planctomycetaceae bacterium]|nr:phosphatase [Planctomycetaceae bacterium]
MAEIQPFRGWRYDIAQVGMLADVVAPPYDVIDSGEQDRLYQRHPCNIVRLILNRDEPGDPSPAARYERAARFLRQWQGEGVLSREPSPALYVYHQSFDWEGVRYDRRGFLCRIRLEEFGTGSVFPHEQTMPGPKADRLALWEHGHTCLSPVFGLYPGDAAAVQAPLDEACGDRPPREVVDADGVTHRLWAVDDADAIARACAELADLPVFIADGHHRYETALNFRRAHPDVDAAGFTMMMLVAMNDPGLAILPTHRLVSGLPDLETGPLAELLGEFFEIAEMGSGREAARAAWAEIDGSGDQDCLALGTAADQRWLLARLKDPVVMESLAADHGEDWQGLGVSRLHTLVLDTILRPAFAGQNLSCRYVHQLEEVDRAIENREVPLAVLVAPATLEHVRRIASQRETMPPKSTFFFPKLLSGLVLYPLEEDS